MAVVQIMSDLHLEFLSAYERGKWIGSLDPTGIDVLILAGDICLREQMEEVYGALCAAFPQIVLVLGNHEYYGSSPSEVHGLLWDLLVKHPNLHWLDNQVEEVAGLRFAGGTLWFPKPGEPAYSIRFGMNDYRVIQDFDPWVYEQNALCEALLDRMASTVDVVVTHHIPADVCISPRFRVGPAAVMNHYFCRDLQAKIQEWKPPLWVFGHTHDRMAVKLYDTLLVCNPLGYPHERESRERGRWAPRCLVSVEPDHSGATIIEDEPGPGHPIGR
jgi:predicted phosphodiesterase